MMTKRQQIRILRKALENLLPIAVCEQHARMPLILGYFRDDEEREQVKNLIIEADAAVKEAEEALAITDSIEYH